MEHDRFAVTVAGLHAQYAAQLTSLYLATRLLGAGANPLKFRVEAQRLARTFVGAAAAEADLYLQRTFYGEVPARVAPFVRSLHAFAAHDAETAGRKLRTDSSRNWVLDARSGDSMRSLLLKRVETLTLTAKDTSGRIWRSEHLLRNLARDFAYQAYIDAAAAQIEGDLAQVSYADPTHANHGLIVSLSGATDHPSLESVRATIFHPNATAMLTHVHA